MRLSVIGCGHLGAVHAVGMAEFGHAVIGLDIDPARVGTLSGGKAWFHEPGLDPLLARHLASGRLRFTTSVQAVADGADVHFLATETPGSPQTGAYDLSRLRSAVSALAPYLRRPALIVGKSTVPVGTTGELAALARSLAPAGAAVEVAWNPEFLREGHAVADTLRPDRIVVGTRSAEAEKLLREVYRPATDAGVPLITTDPATCELVKGSANLFLAAKVSLLNAIGEVCEAAGADAARARQLGLGGQLRIIDEIDAINKRVRRRAVARLEEAAGGSFTGKRITVWGCAFKVGTDDVRDSPSLAVARMAHAAGAQVTACDPVAGAAAAAEAPQLRYADDPAAAVDGADALFIGTAWPRFAEIDPAVLRPAAKVVVDARNGVDRRRWEAAGWTVHRLGAGR